MGLDCRCASVGHHPDNPLISFSQISISDHVCHLNRRDSKILTGLHCSVSILFSPLEFLVEFCFILTSLPIVHCSLSPVAECETGKVPVCHLHHLIFVGSLHLNLIQFLTYSSSAFQIVFMSNEYFSV